MNLTLGSIGVGKCRQPWCQRFASGSGPRARAACQDAAFFECNTLAARSRCTAEVMAIYALLASFVMIVIYVWVRFQNIVFGLAAVVALVHDVSVTVAALAVSYYVAPYLGWAMVDPFKISLDVVAALLTIVGFSINDTIVILDRIREIKGKSPQVTEEIIEQSRESDARPHDIDVGDGADCDDHSVCGRRSRDPSLCVCDAGRCHRWNVQLGLYRLAVDSLVAKAGELTNPPRLVTEWAIRVSMCVAFQMIRNALHGRQRTMCANSYWLNRA